MSALESQDWRVCRLCLSECRLQPIFSVDGGRRSLYLKLTACALVQIRDDDGLPPFVCETCESKLCSFYDFKKQCEAVELKLKQVFKSDDLVLLKGEVCDENDILSDREAASPDPIIDQKSKKRTNKIKKIKQRTDENTYISVQNITTEDDTWHTPEDVAACTQTTCKQFQCELCGDVFKWMSVLNKHLLTHSADKARFACSLCPKRFTRKEYVNVHMRIHAGIRPFICEMCARPFVKRQDLIRHKSIHSDEKNYSCPECNKKFKRSTDVHAHMRTHTGVVPYNCKRCLKGYKSRTGMLKHYNKNQCGISEAKSNYATNVDVCVEKNKNS